MRRAQGVRCTRTCPSPRRVGRRWRANASRMRGCAIRLPLTRRARYSAPGTLSPLRGERERKKHDHRDHRRRDLRALARAQPACARDRLPRVRGGAGGERARRRHHAAAACDARVDRAGPGRRAAARPESRTPKAVSSTASANSSTGSRAASVPAISIRKSASIAAGCIWRSIAPCRSARAGLRRDQSAVYRRRAGRDRRARAVQGDDERTDAAAGARPTS